MFGRQSLNTPAIVYGAISAIHKLFSIGSVWLLLTPLLIFKLLGWRWTLFGLLIAYASMQNFSLHVDYTF